MPRSSKLHRAIAGTLLALLLFFYFRDPLGSSPTNDDQSKYDGSGLNATRIRAIERAFEHAWDGYSTHCMGHDSLHPVSNTCDDELGGWGATAIDALTTAIIMDKQHIVIEILTFVQTIDFKTVKAGQMINLFEVTIRHLGSMLSAWQLLNGPFKTMEIDKRLMQSLYDKIVVLGEVLSCAYNTPSGIPRNWVDPVLCATDDAVSNTLAGAGSSILEFSTLSEITGNDKYYRLAQRSEDNLIDPRPKSAEPWPGLLGSSVSVKDGSFYNSKGSWGSLSDSFYEYLLKGYIYNPNLFTPHLERWKLAADSTIQHVASFAYAHPDWVFLPYWEGHRTTPAMDALSWFAGGNFILGGMVLDNNTILDFGVTIARTALNMYLRSWSQLGGEFVWWTKDCDLDWGEGGLCDASNTWRWSTTEYNLRPEVLETWYYAYIATKDEVWQDVAWQTFEAIEKVCKTDSGYSAISDMTKIDGGEKLDKMESFFFSEVVKYLYLMHIDLDKPYQVQDPRTGAKNQWVFNTEGHPLRVASDPSN